MVMNTIWEFASVISVSYQWTSFTKTYLTNHISIKIYNQIDIETLFTWLELVDIIQRNNEMATNNYVSCLLHRVIVLLWRIDVSVTWVSIYLGDGVSHVRHQATTRSTVDLL